MTSLCLYTCTQPCLPLINGFVIALRNTVSSVNERLVQLVTVTVLFFIASSHRLEMQCISEFSTIVVFVAMLHNSCEDVSLVML